MHCLSPTVFVSSHNPTYSPVYSLTAKYLPPSEMTGTNVYEALYQSSAPVNIVDNPSYQQYSLEPPHTPSQVTHTCSPSQGVIIITDSETNGL